MRGDETVFEEGEPLGPEHSLEGFECGVEDLDIWLREHARQADSTGSARVFVAAAGRHVAGYYALSVTTVDPKAATERLLKGQPEGRPIPALLVARLAVDRRHQGRGLGVSLLRDALLRCAVAAAVVGVRAVVVHATDREIADWYLRWGFEPSPTDPLHLILLLKDLRKLLDSAS